MPQATVMGTSLDASLDSMEECRFRKKHEGLVKELTRKSRFTFSELECLLLMYYKIQKRNEEGPTRSSKKHKETGVTKAQFRDVLHCALDMTDDHLMDRVFLALDKGPSPIIHMDHWIHAFSLFLRGTLEEKITFCFSVYDVMDNGMLAKDGIFHLLKRSMISNSGIEDAEEAARDMIEVITKKMDIDRDGKISFNDYKTSVLKNPMLLEAFGQCLPSRGAVQAFMNTFMNIVPRI